MVSARCCGYANLGDIAGQQARESAASFKRTRTLHQFELEAELARGDSNVGRVDFEDRCAPYVRTDKPLTASNILSVEPVELNRHGASKVLRHQNASVDIKSEILLISNMPNLSDDIDAALRALSNDRRRLILEWLKNPKRHFRAQEDGDLVEDGVCGVLIAEKLGVSQPTVSEHLKVLSQAGFLRGKRVKQWTFYRRDEARIANLKKAIVDEI